MKTNKALLRKKYKEKRQALSKEAIELKSLEIANKVLQLPLWQRTYFHLFLSIKEQKEINTEYLLHILNGKDKNIVISKSDFSDFSMQHFLLTDSTVIKKNKWNIPEPVDGIAIDTQKLDVVFVPLLVFDLKGNRVGYGKGFYDRFLKSCRKDTLKVGLSFFEAEATSINADNDDIALDFCVTPQQIYKFNTRDNYT